VSGQRYCCFVGDFVEDFVEDFVGEFVRDFVGDCQRVGFGRFVLLAGGMFVPLVGFVGSLVGALVCQKGCVELGS
jgi:hypothetical protein